MNQLNSTQLNSTQLNSTQPTMHSLAHQHRPRRRGPKNGEIVWDVFVWLKLCIVSGKYWSNPPWLSVTMLAAHVLEAHWMIFVCVNPTLLCYPGWLELGHWQDNIVWNEGSIFLTLPRESKHVIFHWLLIVLVTGSAAVSTAATAWLDWDTHAHINICVTIMVGLFLTSRSFLKAEWCKWSFQFLRFVTIWTAGDNYLRLLVFLVIHMHRKYMKQGTMRGRNNAYIGIVDRGEQYCCRSSSGSTTHNVFAPHHCWWKEVRIYEFVVTLIVTTGKWCWCSQAVLH